MTFTQQIIEKWATPAGLVIALGLVIWLVQLEARSINNAQSIARSEQALESVANAVAKSTAALARTSALQDALFNQVQQLDDRMERNESLIIMNQRDSHEHGNGNGDVQ